MTAPVEGPDLGELARLEAAATAGPWFREYGDVVTSADDPRDRFDDEPRAEHVVRRAEHRELRDDQAIADAALIVALRNAAPFLLAQAAAVQRVRELCDVVRRLQPADPDTGDRDMSFFALLEALEADDA